MDKNCCTCKDTACSWYSSQKSRTAYVDCWVDPTLTDEDIIKIILDRQKEKMEIHEQHIHK